MYVCARRRTHDVCDFNARDQRDEIRDFSSFRSTTEISTSAVVKAELEEEE